GHGVAAMLADRKTLKKLTVGRQSLSPLPFAKQRLGAVVERVGVVFPVGGEFFLGALVLLNGRGPAAFFHVSIAFQVSRGRAIAVGFGVVFDFVVGRARVFELAEGGESLRDGELGLVLL